VPRRLIGHSDYDEPLQSSWNVSSVGRFLLQTRTRRYTPDVTAVPVAILVFDGVEVLDFCGPFEVFSTARGGEASRDTAPVLFQVFTVAEQDRIVSATGGLEVKASVTIDQCPPVEMVIVPGGQGTRREVGNARILDWLAGRAAATPVMASVCTGAFLLAQAGLLDGRRATTHWDSLDRLRRTYPRVRVVADERVVDEGRVVTAAGISAGIDMSLLLIERYFGPDVAAETARWMEYERRGSSA